MLLPSALGISAWERGRKLLSPNPRQGNPFAIFFGHHGIPRTQDTACLELLTQEWVHLFPHTPHGCSWQPRFLH